MKRLFLVRHAKSSWKHPGLTDFERPLNKRGKKDAPKMGKRIKKQDILPDLILSSPAKRAIRTARAIAGEIGYPEKKIQTDRAIYSGGSPAILSIVQSQAPEVNCLMLFGHNPDFTQLAESLSGHRVDNIPPCGIFCIDFDIQTWTDVAPGGGQFVFFDFPKNTTDSP
ncbi:MAG: histidine phosphatase family protein [bacterium]|nr:histidine phosphatase family protein [bacterium]